MVRQTGCAPSDEQRSKVVVSNLVTAADIEQSNERLAISWHRTVSTLVAIVTIALLTTASVDAGPLHESSAMPAAATEGISAAGISDSANPGPCDTSGLTPPPERCVPRSGVRILYGPARLLTIDDPNGRWAGETLPIHPVGEASDVDRRTSR